MNSAQLDELFTDICIHGDTIGVDLIRRYGVIPSVEDFHYALKSFNRYLVHEIVITIELTTEEEYEVMRFAVMNNDVKILNLLTKDQSRDDMSNLLAEYCAVATHKRIIDYLVIGGADMQFKNGLPIRILEIYNPQLAERL
jgi:hypothetical protein